MKAAVAGRLAAELVVIVLGVLLALAADRWNQGRADVALESAYVARLIEEIRADSTQLESRLDQIPSALAARDSLLSVLDGSVVPSNLAATIVSATPSFYLNPPNAWRELLAASSLNILRDPTVREAVSTYYGVNRERNDVALDRVQERGRQPFYDAVYRLRIFEPSVSTDGTAITNLSEAVEAAGRAAPDVRGFQRHPEMRELLNGLGAMYFFQAVNVSQALRAAGRTLQVLEAANR